MASPIVDTIAMTGRHGHKVVLEVRHTLWLRAYLAALLVFCRIVGKPADSARLLRMVERGSRFRVVAGSEASGFISLRDFREAQRYMIG